MERFDWRAAADLRKKKRRGWDAIEQLIRYRQVIGDTIPISAEAIRSGELFRDDIRSAE